MLTSKQGLIIKILLAQNPAGLPQFGKFLKGIFTNWPPFPEVFRVWLHYLYPNMCIVNIMVLKYEQLSNIYNFTRFQRLMTVSLEASRLVPAFYCCLLPKGIPLWVQICELLLIKTTPVLGILVT